MLPLFEVAANDRRLARVPGLGPKRLRVIRFYQHEASRSPLRAEVRHAEAT
jgi:hypothetical protein